MEESLRLAYLAAMDIPVWLLRAADPHPVELEPAHPAPAPAPAPAESLETVAPARAHRARDLLGDSAPVRPAAPRAAASRERVVAQAPAPAEAQACALLLVPTGHTLFIDQAPPQGRERRVLDLLAALAIAIGGEQVAALPYPFAWPPQGVSYDPAQARDAVCGMLAKLRETTRFDQVIVMGEQAAALLLDWDGAQYRAREPRSQRIIGIDVPLLVTHSAAELLENPLLKRVVWSEIQVGSQRDA